MGLVASSTARAFFTPARVSSQCRTQGSAISSFRPLHDQPCHAGEDADGNRRRFGNERRCVYPHCTTYKLGASQSCYKSDCLTLG